MGSHLRQASKFGADLDEDLLGYISIDASGDDGNEAAAELYRRHSKPLFRILRGRWPGRVVDADSLADLVHDTFLAAFKSAGKYQAKGGDPDRQRRSCLSWLVGIAKNLLLEALRARVSVVAEVEFEDCADLACEVAVADQGGERGAAAMVESALAQLTERERDVVCVTMNSYRPGEKNQRLANNDSANLAAAWGTTTTNIRMIRKRAFDKVRAILEPNLKLRESR